MTPGPVPMRSTLLTRLRARLRAVARLFLLALFFFEASVELVWTRSADRLGRAEWLHRFCARSLRRMGIAVRVHGQFPASGAVISNHHSYLDIVVMAAIRPCVFVSKSEVARMPVIGWMTTMSGTVYVERGRGGSALQAGRAVQTAVAEGLPVVFFPEGTTNTGDGLLKFHAGLIGQVVSERIPMTAARIRYRLAEANLPGVTVAEDVHWGTAGLFAHVFRFLSLRGVEADVYFADAPLVFSSDLLHRKTAAAEAQAAVARLGEAAVSVAV